jgi:hypothetical protein
MVDNCDMNELNVWIILAWIALPTVMYGGYALLKIINRGDVLTPVQVSLFRAGHAHAGVLLLMSLLYYIYLDKHHFPYPSSMQHARCWESECWLSPAASLCTWCERLSVPNLP